MRTTVELDPALMRAAKARSAELGESLKSLLSRAVSAELDAEAPRSGRRVTLPLFGRRGKVLRNPSNADLEAALADADAASIAPRTPRS
jgi:hypothetical protein